VTNDYLQHPLVLEAVALAKDLPDHQGSRSWAFEPYLVLSNPEAQNLVDLLIDEVCAQWMDTFDTRQPSTETQQRFWDCGHAILANLMRAKCNRWPTTIGMYRSKGALDRERRYRPSYMTADRFRTVQDFLIGSGYVEMVTKGHNLPGDTQTSRFALTKGGARELQADAWTYADFKVERGRETIRLKDINDRLCGYDDTPETDAMRARLDEINTKLDATEIGTTRPLTVIDRKPEYSGRKVRLHRVFGRRNFQHGGRFYGGWWQHIKSAARATITLDGQPTIEADFRGFNPAALMAEAGLPIPDDPYAPIVGADAPKELRDHAKTTLAAFLNSKSGRTEEPSNFDSIKWGMTPEDFRQKVLDAFPMVLAMLGSDKGMKLQRLESDLAEAIMLHFVRQGHAILPIHDAFIVQAHLEGELVQVMKDTFKARLGQVPPVKVTPSYVLR
jgi:hypothetical protein